jgi:hypothetical protein
VRRCGGQNPIPFFKGENVRTTTLLAFLKEINITERTFIDEPLSFCQFHHSREHCKVQVYRCSADIR